MNNIALLYKDQERWAEAEKLQVQVLIICKKKLGSEHPNTLTSMGNLALTYYKEGRLNEAEGLNAHVREVRKSKDGKAKGGYLF